MNYSAQAIVIDEDSNIYLENNTVIWSLSFIGWKLEKWENAIEALKREIGEELWLYLPDMRFLDWELQPKRVFAGISWVSTYFILQLSDSEVQKIEKQANIDINTYDFSTLERLEDDMFPIERIAFLQQIQRALDSVM